MHRHADRHLDRHLDRYSGRDPDRRVDPGLDRCLRRLVAVGALAVLLLPAARGYSPWLGWMPLWLVAMPLGAWWALHRFALPLPRAPRQARAGLSSRRRRGAQARRRPGPRPALARAA